MEHFAGEHTAGLPVRDGCDAAGAADAAPRCAAAGVSAADGRETERAAASATPPPAAGTGPVENPPAGAASEAGLTPVENPLAGAAPEAGLTPVENPLAGAASEAGVASAENMPADAVPVAEIRGVVEHGRRLGRELGFPTANLAVDEALAAEDGVYASLVEVGGVRYRAMSNLGRNPSVGGQPRHLETHLFGFEGSLYGREVRVVLLRKVRDERRFDTVEELRAQIARDKEQILNLKMNLK